VATPTAMAASRNAARAKACAGSDRMAAVDTRSAGVSFPVRSAVACDVNSSPFAMRLPAKNTNEPSVDATRVVTRARDMTPIPRH